MLEFVLLAMLTILLFVFIFLLLLFYSKIGLSLLLNQIIQPYLILLDSVYMCSISKLKLTIKNTINCIVHCKICMICAFSQLATCYLEFQTGQPLTWCLLQMKFPRRFLYYAPIILALCFILSSPCTPKIMPRHNRLKPSA